MLIGPLRGGGEVEQFLSQIEERGLRLEKIGGRKVGGQNLKGRIHIHKGRVSHSRGIFGGLKKIRRLKVR